MPSRKPSWHLGEAGGTHEATACSAHGSGCLGQRCPGRHHVVNQEHAPPGEWAAGGKGTGRVRGPRIDTKERLISMRAPKAEHWFRSEPEFREQQLDWGVPASAEG